MTNATLINTTAQEPDYDTVGTDPDTVVPASPVDSKAVDDTLGLQEVTIRLDKETFRRLEAKAKEQGIITKALIRNTLADSVKPVPVITEFGTVELDEHDDLCLYAFKMDFKGLDIRRDVGCVYALIAYLQNEINKHLLQYPETDTVESFPDGTLSDYNENMLARVKEQNNIITP